MHNPPATRIKFDRSALRQCVGQHNNCRQLVVRALQYPSPAVIASIAGRVFNRDLKYQRSSSGDANGTIINGDDGLFVRIPFEGCTVHIAKMVCAPFDAHAAALERAGRHCEPGDIVILESLDLSKGHCFPYHSAFGRFQEILSLYQEGIGHPTTNEELTQLTCTTSYGAIIQMGAPVRLLGDRKMLPAMIMEGISPCVQMMDVISTEEFNTVSAELRRIGNDSEVSVSSFTVNRILYAASTNEQTSLT